MPHAPVKVGRGQQRPHPRGPLGEHLIGDLGRECHDGKNAGDVLVRHVVVEQVGEGTDAVSYTHLRAHETVLDLVCRLLLEKKKERQM